MRTLRSTPVLAMENPFAACLGFLIRQSGQHPARPRNNLVSGGMDA